MSSTPPMNTGGSGGAFEYPDEAGYPDGAGFLDEGTAALVDEVIADDVRDVDRPSADSETEIDVRRDDERGAYRASMGALEVANLRFDETDGRVVVLSMSVVPEFRGRGIATALIADALDDIRARRQRVTVNSRAVADFIAQNPQFADLLDPEHPGR